MPTYYDIKTELIEIAEIVKQYPESVQSKVFDLLIENYLEEPAISEKGLSDDTKEPKKKPPTAAETPKPKKKQSASKETHSIIKDLQLRGDKDIQSLVDFNNQKKPRSNIDFNAVAIYYLQNILGIQEITLDHVYTCYREVGRKPPARFQQSIYDTSGNRYGYIDASDINNLKVPHRGVIFVEHDLPRKTKKASDKS
jgi:hypothetical protein